VDELVDVGCAVGAGFIYDAAGAEVQDCVHSDVPFDSFFVADIGARSVTEGTHVTIETNLDNDALSTCCDASSPPAEQITPGGPWRIRIDQPLRDRIRPEVPDGWLGLDEAATALGLARQTVLHKVQRGELQAFMSTEDAAKASVSRSNPISMDYSRHPDRRRAQC